MSRMNRAALFTSIAGVVAFSPLQQYAGLSCIQNAAETIAEKKRSHRRLANTFKGVPSTGTDSVQLLAYKKIDEPETWARTANSSAEPARNSVAQTAVTEVMAEPKTATTVATTSTVASTSVAASTSVTNATSVAKPQLFLNNVPSDYLLANVNSDTESGDWSVGSGCNKRCDVRFRCYNLGEGDPEELWSDICKKTGSLASYGYVEGNRLYVIFEKGGVFKADTMACGFDTQLLACFNIKGWTNGKTLVLRAQDATGRTVAIKAFPASNEKDNCSEMQSEWDIMHIIKDMPNVSQPMSLQFYNGNGYLVSSWVGKPLSNLTAQYEKNHSRCGAALHQLLLQIEHLQRLGIAHRDIKPSNITLTGTGTGKVTLIDFGLACNGDTIDDIAGTFRYMAPECVAQLFTPGIEQYDLHACVAQTPGIEQYDLHAADIYSLGITMSELFFGDKKTRPHLLTKSSVDSALSDLLRQMCRLEPQSRITAAAALEHNYFKLLGIGQREKVARSRVAGIRRTRR